MTQQLAYLHQLHLSAQFLSSSLHQDYPSKAFQALKEPPADQDSYHLS